MLPRLQVLKGNNIDVTVRTWFCSIVVYTFENLLISYLHYSLDHSTGIDNYNDDVKTSTTETAKMVKYPTQPPYSIPMKTAQRQLLLLLRESLDKFLSP